MPKTKTQTMKVKSTGGFLTAGGTAEQREIAKRVNSELNIKTVTGEIVQMTFCIWRRRGDRAHAPIKTAETRRSATEKQQAKLAKRSEGLAETQKRIAAELAEVTKRLTK